MLLEGRSSPRRFWRMTVLGLLLVSAVMAPMLSAIDWAAAAVNPRAAREDSIAVWLVIIAFSLIVSLVQARGTLANSGWMLTSRRFGRQGAGSIPREEIGKVTRAWPGGLIVHRSGPDALLRGPRYRLDYLDGPENVRDALERLK
ncbi:MAG: hypothetical protein H0T41_08630 [Rhodobacteraceae bacterium]|nr:hypothetical protein [Paracoccaceae bacterium]